MFPKKSRLPRAEMEENFYKIFSSPYFLVKGRQNGRTSNRFAIIIPSRAVPKSTRRHFFKRFFSRALSEWQSTGKDFIIILSAKVEGATKTDITSEINRASRSI